MLKKGESGRGEGGIIKDGKVVPMKFIAPSHDERNAALLTSICGASNRRV